MQHLTLLGMKQLFPSWPSSVWPQQFSSRKKTATTALCVRRGASGTSSGTVTVIGRELPRTQRTPRPASIKTGLPPKKGAFEIWARLLISYSDNHATMKCKMLHNSAEILILWIRISKFYNFCTMWVQHLTLLGDCLSIAWFSAVNRPERENRSLQARIK